MDNVDKKQITKFINSTSDVIDRFSESELDEQTTKRYIISNFLDNVLDWPISELKDGYTVPGEYTIQIASNTKKVDYALLDESNEPICIVEAKRISTSLSDKEKKQIKSYMKAEELIWGILSNGKEYCFYIRDDEDTIKEIEISHTTYSNLESIKELISLYSFDNLKSGESLDNRKEILKRYRRVESFNADKTKNTLYDVLSPEDEKEKQAINEFVNKYQNIIKSKQTIFLSLDTDDKKENTSKNVEIEGSIIDTIESSTPVKFNDGEVIFDESISSTKHLESVVNILFKIGYISDEDIPINRGSKRYLINTKPVDSEGDDMYGPKELSNGHYLETNYSTEYCKKIISELIELKE